MVRVRNLEYIAFGIYVWIWRLIEIYRVIQKERCRRSLLGIFREIRSRTGKIYLVDRNCTKVILRTHERKKMQKLLVYFLVL